MSSSRRGIPRACASRRATQGQMYTSPTSWPPGAASGNESTSVGRPCPLCAALSRRIESLPRNVTEISPCRRSAFNTVSTTRRISARDSGSPRPCTTTSLTLNRLELRCNATAGPGIADTLVIGAGHDPGEFPLDAVQIAESERRIVELSGSKLLLDEVLDGTPNRLGRWIGQNPNCSLSGVGEHGHCGLCRLRPWARVAVI